MWIEIKRQKGKEEKINVSREDYVRPQISLKKKKSQKGQRWEIKDVEKRQRIQSQGSFD